MTGGIDRVIATFSDEEYYYGHSVIPAITSGADYSGRALLAIVNSKLLSWYNLMESPNAQKDTFPKMNPTDVGNLPIVRELSEDTQSLLASHAGEISETKETRQSLNLNLLDYLGNYADGPGLPDVGLFQPTSPNLLDSTKEDHDNLRIGDVKTERSDSTVAIHATARYKPENEDEHATDQWGYTETDYLEAFSLADLTENEAALVEAFAPVAVEEAGGFAGFREAATKTNSLLDRLEAITLPDPDDVAADLRRYIETRERADEFDEKIERINHLIDEIVYELYRLTDEEREVVESALQD